MNTRTRINIHDGIVCAVMLTRVFVGLAVNPQWRSVAGATAAPWPVRD